MIKKHKALTAYILALMVFTTYVILDTFVITRVYGEEADASTGQEISQDDATGSDSTNGGDNMTSDGQSGADDGSGSSGDQASGNMHSGDGSGEHHGGKGPGKGRGRHSGDGSSGSGSTDGKSSSGSGNSGSSNSSGLNQTGTSIGTYSNDNYSITVTEYREYDSSIYVADVTVSSPEYLKTALAQGSYGRNVTQKTSEIAGSVNAVLAINGDYYGAQEKGYVIRNGKLYRDTALAGQEDLVIYKDGSFGIINESDVTASQLISSGAVQTLSFGPALVTDGKISVTENEEVGKAMASNPRTAIGIIDKNHYVLVVSDGRTSDSAGLSLYEMAQFMNSLGASTAYNLDGGGSSTMYFNGSIVNNPTTGGSIRERSVSDIVYIG